MDWVEEDEALVRRLVDGDPTALATLYDRYAGVAFSLLFRMLGDRTVAEEVLQEVFLRVWQRAATYRDSRGRFAPWLLAIAHHLAIDELRRRRRQPARVTDQEATERTLALVPDPAPDVAEATGAREERERIEAALATLPAAQRLALELAYFDGYSQTEIAARLGQPLGTVKTRIRLGLRKLRDLLQARELGFVVDEADPR